MGGRLPVTLIDRVGKAFQFTPLRGGRPELRNFARPCIGYFNSRPRVGGDFTHSVRIVTTLLISIHAPAWGATKCYHAIFTGKFISIHAPAWGATILPRKSEWRLTDFNSRPRVGGDYAGSTQAAAPHISIHAPAWGATASLASLRGTLRFQFTPPRGGRQGSPAHPAPSHNFNSRPRVGGDPKLQTYCIWLSNFNSRPRVGGDSHKRR